LATIVELQESVAVPELVTLAGVIAPQVRLAGTVSVRLTVPVNAFKAVIVIVEVAETPGWVTTGDVTAMLKSTTWTITVIV
jgi:hypothetical protein